jgi:UDP-N-acetyl-D-galactosamine dehydrogenase
MNQSNKLICIIGLGYVGLPLAVEFGKKRNVIGYDINSKRIQDLKENYDSTKEVQRSDLQLAKQLEFTSDLDKISEAKIYIVTVPTPIDENNEPNLSPLINASKDIAKSLKKDDIVIYESTVFPGATEDVCVPILEEVSGLTFNKDFFCGYSPERINPGDKSRSIRDIIKVTSGSNTEIALQVDKLYGEIISAGTHMAPSIRVAEAAKVIENTQRDLNIALMNELSVLFNKMDIDINSVLKAANTKWNFLDFKPGLVGGHCIGVDPYYLTHIAESVGYRPNIILAGRKLNDGMSKYVADQILSILKIKDITPNNASILVMGLTFKENCPDLRNTKVIDLVNCLSSSGAEIDVFDPVANHQEALEMFGLDVSPPTQDMKYDAIVIAVPHNIFLKNGFDAVKKLCKENYMIYDLKNCFETSSDNLYKL